MGTDELSLEYPWGMTCKQSLKSDGVVVEGTVKLAKLTTGSAEVKTLETFAAKASRVTARRIAPLKKDSKIKVQGAFRISGSMVYTAPIMDVPVSPLSFFEDWETEAESLPKPWRRVSLDTFDVPSIAEGWFVEQNTRGGREATPAKQHHFSSCNNRNTFLGGACKTSNQALQKVWSNLPQHQELRVTAAVHFIDSWENESAFLNVDGNIVWVATKVSATQQSIGRQKNPSLCGDPAVSDAALGTKIDISFPHNMNT